MESGIALGNGDGALQTGGDASSVGPVQAFYVGSGGAESPSTSMAMGSQTFSQVSVELLSEPRLAAGVTTASTTILSASASSVLWGKT